MKKIIMALLFLSLSGCAIGFRTYDQPHYHVCYYRGGVENVFYTESTVQYVCRDGSAFTFWRND